MWGGRLLIRCATGLLLLTIGALAACQRSSGVLPPEGLDRGELAPSLTGVDAAGDDFRLTQMEGQRLVLFYRTGACGLCVLRLRELQHRLSEYAALGVAVVAATTDPPEALGATAREVAPDFPLVSVEPAVAATWEVAAADSMAPPPLVAVYLLDSRGVVIHRRISSTGGDRVADAELLTLLEQRRNAE